MQNQNQNSHQFTGKKAKPKAKKKNIRLIVLSILAVLSCLLYISVATPLSPLGNMCEDVEYAKEQYANKNISKRNKFIVERNKHCRVLISERKNETNIYKKLENCSILDSAIDASERYISLEKEKNPAAAREAVEFIKNNLDNFNYCPQYGDLAKKYQKLDKIYK